MDGQKPEKMPSSAPQPGSTIQPGQTVSLQEQTPVEAVSLPTPAAEPSQKPAVQPAPSFYEAEPAASPYADEAVGSYGYAQTDQGAIEWTASEFVDHQKDGSWYTLLIVGAMAVGVGSWFISKDVVTSAVILIVAVLFALYAKQKPQQLQYRVDASGLTIGQKHYSYNEFKAFGVMHDGAMPSIIFYPIKRFGILVSVYYDPQQEDQIINVVSNRVPYQEAKPDAVDALMRRIRL